MKQTTLSFLSASHFRNLFCNSLAVFLFAVWPSASDAQAAVLVGWNFDSFAVGSTPAGPIDPDVSATGVIFGGLARGAGLSGYWARSGTSTSNLTTVMRFVNGVAARTESQAFSRDVYAEFSLAPAPGYKLNLLNFSMDAYSPGTIARNFFVEYSTDNWVDTRVRLIPATATTGDGTFVQGDLNLTDVTTPVQFRIYGFAPLDSSSANRALQYDNIFVNGTVTAIPEPTSASLVCLGVVGLLLRRHRSAR